MLAPSNLPYPRDTRVIPLDEESWKRSAIASRQWGEEWRTVIVAADGLVEGSQLGGSEFLVVLVAHFACDVSGDGSEDGVELQAGALILLEHVFVLDARRRFGGGGSLGRRFLGGRRHDGRVPVRVEKVGRRPTFKRCGGVELKLGDGGKESGRESGGARAGRRE